MYLIAGCKLFKQIEKLLKTECFGQKIKPSSIQLLKNSLINKHALFEKYFGNSWVRHVYEGARSKDLIKHFRVK